jgi:hypothetical protein
MKAVPYASAASGANARDEITKLLRRFGCESVGFMDDFEKHEVLLAFTHRGRQIQLRASAKGWAQMFGAAALLHSQDTSETFTSQFHMCFSQAAIVLVSGRVMPVQSVRERQ